MALKNNKSPEQSEKKSSQRPRLKTNAKIVNIKADDVERIEIGQMKSFFLSQLAEKSYSNTIELYDFIPKYVWGKVERIQEKFLDPIEREFEYRSQNYHVRISPARIKDQDGTSRDYFPGKREELVEDALRKLATSGQGIMMDDRAGVFFTLYQLHHELKRNGRTYSIKQLKDALMICVGTTVQLTDEQGQAILATGLFEAVGLQTKEDWAGKGEKTSAYVRFNGLVTKSIKAKTFRQFNYEVSMSYKSVISRQLHKRMSHHFKRAGLENPYSINLSSIIRSFGLTAYQKISHNLRDVKAALNEMVEKEVVLKYEISKILDQIKQNKISDFKIKIFPHPKFVNEIVSANNKQRVLNNI